MSNDYYTHTTFPATGSQGSSASMRSELDLVDAGFTKLAPLTGNGNKFLLINSSGTAQTASSLLTEQSGRIQVDASLYARDKLVLQRSTGSSWLEAMAFADTLGGARSDNLSIGNNAGGALLLHTNSAERARVLSTGEVLIGRTTSSGLGPLQVADAAGSLADFSSTFAGTSLLRLRHTGAQFTGLAIQNSATGSSSANGLRLIIDTAGAGYLSQEENAALIFSTNAIQRMSIAASGLVTAVVGFAGPGSGLTALNASNLGSGTVPDARFPATLPSMSGVNLTALNASNLGSGTVPDARFPATLPSMSGVNLTALNASNVSSGTLANARTTGVAAATANTLALRDANGDTAVRGLTLGNTAVAGNVLDFYQEDTWTVTVTGASLPGTATGLAVQEASYTRIGDRIYGSLKATYTSHSGSGAIVVSLPVAAAVGTATAIGSGYVQSDTPSDVNCIAILGSSSTTMELKGGGSVAQTGVTFSIEFQYQA